MAWMLWVILHHFFWEQCRTICGIFGELFFKYFVDMFLFGSTRTYTIFFMIILWTKMYKWTGVGKKWIHKCKYDVICTYNIIKHIIKKIYVLCIYVFIKWRYVYDFPQGLTKWSCITAAFVLALRPMSLVLLHGMPSSMSKRKNKTISPHRRRWAM